jgi:hypothetical protein
VLPIRTTITLVRRRAVEDHAGARASIYTREGSLRSLFKGGFTPPNSKIWSKCRTHGISPICFLEQRVLRSHRRGIVRPPGRNYCPSYARRPGGRNRPFNRLVRGFLALLAFCYYFLGGGRIRGRGRREPAPPGDGTARGCPCALVRIPWCHHRAVGRP